MRAIPAAVVTQLTDGGRAEGREDDVEEEEEEEDESVVVTSCL